MNNTQETHTFNMNLLNVSENKTYSENRENPVEYLEKTKMEEHFNNGHISDIGDVSDTIKEVQGKKIEHGNSEGGDGLKLYHENKIQLETMEKEFDGLKIQNQFIKDKVQLITDRYKFRDDQMTIIKAEMNKVQKEMYKMGNEKIAKELEHAVYFKTVVEKLVAIQSQIDRFTVLVKDLETGLGEAVKNEKIAAEIMQVSEYMSNQYGLHIAEDRRHFVEQASKHASAMDQLKALADAKDREVEELERRAADQQLCIDFHEKLTERLEKCTHDMLSIVLSYTKQLENDEKNQLAVPEENQKDMFLILVKQLEEIYEIIRNERKSRHSFIIHCMEKHDENSDEEKDFSVD